MGISDSLSEKVADEIRVALVRRRMSAKRLAEAVGVSQSAMSARLTGTTPIDLDELERIAQALEVDLADLLPHTAAAPESTSTATGQRVLRRDQRRSSYYAAPPTRPTPTRPSRTTRRGSDIDATRPSDGSEHRTRRVERRTSA